jgi:hypothetical protein
MFLAIVPFFLFENIHTLFPRDYIVQAKDNKFFLIPSPATTTTERMANFVQKLYEFDKKKKMMT